MKRKPGVFSDRARTDGSRRSFSPESANSLSEAGTHKLPRVKTELRARVRPSTDKGKYTTVSAAAYGFLFVKENVVSRLIARLAENMRARECVAAPARLVLVKTTTTTTYER